MALSNSVMLQVDGTTVKAPSAMTWGLQDVSAPDAGRDLSGTMYKGRIGYARTLALEWWMPTPEEAAAILQAFLPEYVQITYYDALLNAERTAEFYTGDKSAPVQQWFVGGKRYSKISFTAIERSLTS